ncbi:MAG TPA: dihydrolipoyl dehydrogenase [Opitutales bacterium]|nr:dihydrolipoyl dehydrogenase [Opitutales bacterium]
MSEDNVYDLVVIGGGPAGYAGAIRAGQLGKKVACVEMERPGGTCLNWGCIPTKALLKSAELYDTMRHAEVYGFKCEGITVDFAKVMQRSRVVADQMSKGISFLFKKNKVEHVIGKGSVNVPGVVEIISGEAKGRVLQAKNILLATGCRAKVLPGLKPDGERVFTSFEALQLKKVPASMIILGAGAIGVEFAYFLNAFGCKVTLVEMLPRILPIEDDEVSAVLERAFKRQNIDVRTGVKAENIVVAADGVKLDLAATDGTRTSVAAEALLVAVGVTANTDGLLSPKVKLGMDRGYITVDNRYQTNIKGIYGAGDIIGPPWLAHVATYEAVQAVNGMFDHGPPHRVERFPGCTYCQPQVASIGLTERACKEKGLQYQIGKFPFTASGKAVAVNHPEGFVKVIVESNSGEILGAHIIGSDATELIAEFGLAMELEATWEEIHATIHAHPTLSEAVGEAVAASHGEAIHI